MNSNYMQAVKLSDEEQIKLYMKCKKKELAEMLGEANKALKYQTDNLVNIAIKVDVTLAKEVTNLLNKLVVRLVHEDEKKVCGACKLEKEAKMVIEKLS